MPQTPLISVVVPSFNQAPFLGETLQSLADQNYPNLEVIIEDDCSSDNSVEIAQRFVEQNPSQFKLFTAKQNEGQAAALNRGFRRARGEILAFLNSDDTLLPGCLSRVASEIDPQRSRYVVFGRCIFTGSGSRYVGVEHPAFYRSHFEMLAIWKRRYNTIPQPSVFWHRSVMERCGHLDKSAGHVLDYDLFCRFSRCYYFHKVDMLWSTYRMHANSRSSQRTEDEVLEASIAVSRRNWGPRWRPLYWRCALSLWLHDQHLHELARHHARATENAWRDRNLGRAFVSLILTAVCSPLMAWSRFLLPWFSRLGGSVLSRAFSSAEGFTGLYSDSWIGPLYRTSVAIPTNSRSLVVILQHLPQGYHQKIEVSLLFHGKVVDRKSLAEQSQFFLSANVTPYSGKSLIFEIRSNSFFVPRLVHNTPDDRRLSVQLFDTRIE